jgi:hypothetical protein
VHKRHSNKLLRASPKTPKLSEISDDDFNRAYFKDLKANRHDDWTDSDLSDAASSDHRKKKAHNKPPRREASSKDSSQSE